MTRPQSGFTYLALLFFVAIMGVALAATGVLWSTARQRDKEQELLFIGNEFRKAIASYYERTPGAVKRYPASVDNLLKDNRHLTTQRYLRKVYLDPMTGSTEWGTVRAADGGIMGVYSLSERGPLKTGNFRTADQALAGKLSYAEWKFVYVPIYQPPATQPGLSEK